MAPIDSVVNISGVFLFVTQTSFNLTSRLFKSGVQRLQIAVWPEPCRLCVSIISLTSSTRHYPLTIANDITDSKWQSLCICIRSCNIVVPLESSISIPDNLQSDWSICQGTSVGVNCLFAYLSWLCFRDQRFENLNQSKFMNEDLKWCGTLSNGQRCGMISPDKLTETLTRSRPYHQYIGKRVHLHVCLWIRDTGCVLTLKISVYN